MNNRFHRDLLGDPIDPGRGLAGRPRHIPTAALRAKVAAMHQAGANQGDIAAALGITRPTLRLNYAAQLGSQSKAGAKRAARDLSKGMTDGSMEERER